MSTKPKGAISKRKSSPSATGALRREPSTPPAVRSVRALHLLLGLLALLVFVGIARVPFLSNNLVGEETYFGVLTVNNGSDNIDDAHHNFLFQARFGGQMYYGAPSHPIPPYLFITKVLRPFSDGANFDTLSYAAKSRMVRLRYFACFLVALALMLAVAYDALKGSDRLTVGLSLGLIGFTLTTPIMVGGSIQPQLDGSLGVMLIAVAAFAIYFSMRRRTLIPAALFGGFIAAMGKNEWALTLLAATAAVMAASWFFRRRAGAAEAIPMRRVAVLGGCVIAGVVAGSLTSYAIDSWNFLHGLMLMVDFQKKSSSRWLEQFVARLPFNWPVYPLALASVLVALVGLKKLLSHSVHHAVLLLWGLGLFAGFFISSWAGDGFPRYFCTPIFCLLFFLAAFLPRAPLAPGAKIAGILLLVLGLAFNIISLNAFSVERRALGSSPTTTMDNHSLMLDSSLAKVKARPGALVTVNTDFAFYYPKCDFIANSTPEDRAAELRALYDRLHSDSRAAAALPPGAGGEVK